jgi:hypothetical protein
MANEELICHLTFEGEILGKKHPMMEHSMPGEKRCQLHIYSFAYFELHRGV